MCKRSRQIGQFICVFLFLPFYDGNSLCPPEAQQRQGIVNGGHTFAAVREAVETADDDQMAALQQAFVRLHLLQGVPHDMVAEIAEG